MKPSQLLREEMLRRFDRWAPIIDAGLATQLNFTVKAAAPVDQKVLISGEDADGVVALCDPKHERRVS